jgi:hypothetical protein
LQKIASFAQIAGWMWGPLLQNRRAKASGLAAVQARGVSKSRRPRRLAVRGHAIARSRDS